MSTTVTVFQNTPETSTDTDDAQETLSSIQRLMALSGLSWDYKQPKSAQRCTPSSVVACMYSSLVCIVFILVFVEVVSIYTTANTFTETVAAISSHVVVVLLLIYWGLSTNIHSKIRIFCQRLHEIRLKFKSSAPNPLLRKRVKRTCLCLQVFAVLMCVVSAINVGVEIEPSSELYWPLFILGVLYGGCNTLQSMSVLLLFLSISLLLTYEYDVCTLRLVRASEGCVKEEEIEDIRDYHASLTDLVDYVCSFISLHVAAAYLASFLIICFSLYILINDSSAINYIGFSAYFGFIAMLNVITLTYLGIRLHEAAHRPLMITHDLAGRKMSDRVMGLVPTVALRIMEYVAKSSIEQEVVTFSQVTLFSNKLSQRQIGITAAGLVTITKDTVLTIIGTLLTYVFIVIQFKPEVTAGPGLNANNTSE